MNIQARGMNGTSRWGCYRLLPSQGLRETTVWIGVVRDFCAFRLNAPLFFFILILLIGMTELQREKGEGEKKRDLLTSGSLFMGQAKAGSFIWVSPHVYRGPKTGATFYHFSQVYQQWAEWEIEHLALRGCWYCRCCFNSLMPQCRPSMAFLRELSLTLRACLSSWNIYL